MIQPVCLAPQVLTLAALAARTAGANGSGVPTKGHGRFLLLCNITASLTDAGDTLNVYVDVLGPDGSTWLNAVHFTEQAGNGAARKEFAVLDPANPGTAVINVTADAAAAAVRPALFGSQMRARWAIVDSGNADQSHTFSVLAYAL